MSSADPLRHQRRKTRFLDCYRICIGCLQNANDEEFLDLIKMAADLDDRIDRGPEPTLFCARLICALGRGVWAFTWAKQKCTGETLESAAPAAGLVAASAAAEGAS
jgi:hypothetical protein